MEYCDITVLLKREQYFIDSLNPVYNIAKIAGGVRTTLGWRTPLNLEKQKKK